MKQATNLQLISALTAERAALKSFLALLEREQGLLLENLSDQLLELSEQKSTDAVNLNKLAEARRLILLKNLPILSAEAIRVWLGAYCPEGLIIWEEVIVLAERAKRLNQTIGELIHMKLRRNQQLFAALSKAANKASLYGRSGHASFSPGSGRSLGSG